MTENIQKKLSYLKSEEYKKYRKQPQCPIVIFPEGTSDIAAHKALFRLTLAEETPVLFEDDIFGFNRRLAKTPEGKCGKRYFGCSIGNVTPDYAYLFATGMDTIAAQIKEKLFACMDIIRATAVALPVKRYDVIVKNICNTGVDIVATKSVEA